MALFGRKKGSKDDSQDDSQDTRPVDEAIEAGQADGDVDGDEQADPAGRAGETARREGGPWDVSEAPPDQARVNLGGLQLLGVDGLELRLEIDRATDKVIAATAVAKGGQVQIQVFAAPRRAGLWDDIRAEIMKGINASGGSAEESDGRFGVELVAKVPATDKPGSLEPARFAGVDGPRWFLRALFSGAAVRPGAAATALEQVVADAVVVRGAQAMAPRDPLPLHLPDAPPQPGAETGPVTPTAPTLDGLKRRGPEITEIH